MKRIVSLVLALSMVLSMFSFSFAGNTLPDVEATDYEAAVSALVELGIVNGYEDGTYKPERAVSRAEMAKFLVVSAGLEPAADVSKGATKFSDVDANHWATGYINVATQYGYINGYPEGTFAPDATVSYAEAVTMAIRVLGYKSVVESKGTWPTNYIAKAQELKVLDDVKYGKYTEGATRGNVALLMWNMLTTDMWDVTSENESNGLNYSNENGVTMIDKYFEDYSYIDEDADVIVTDISLRDGKVYVYLTSRILVRDDNNQLVPAYENEVELAKDVDFLNLLGRTVSVLYNDEEEVAVMVIPSNDDKVVEGYVDVVSGDKEYKLPTTAANLQVWGSGDSGDISDTTYSSNVILKGKEVEYSTVYVDVVNSVVKEIKEVKNGIRVKGYDNKTYTLDEEAIVLIDGKWATAADIEEEDVLSELVAGDLYVVSRDVVEGTFEAIEEKADMDETTYTITVDNDEYDVYYSYTQNVVEVDEDEVETETALRKILNAKDEDEETKFFGEDVTLYLNFLGEVVRVEFGEINKELAGSFYVATNCPEAYWTVTDKNGSTNYIELNGESYEIKSTVSGDITSIASGDVVIVDFDNKGRVKEVQVVADGLATEDFTFTAVVSGDVHADELLDDYNYISGDKGSFKVTSSTVVYTITPVKDEEDDKITDHFEVEITKGAAALEGVEAAIIAVESGDTFGKAAYVFVWEEAKNTEKTFGLVDAIGTASTGNSTTWVRISGTKYNEVDEDTEPYALNNLVSFVENDGVVKVTKAYTMSYIAGLVDTNRVTDVEGRVAILNGSATPKDLDKEDENYEDAKIYEVTVTLDDNFANIFDDVEEVSYESMRLAKDDILVEDLANDIVLVIRGYDFE